jgi:hypothetical protein
VRMILHDVSETGDASTTWSHPLVFGDGGIQSDVAGDKRDRVVE